MARSLIEVVGTGETAGADISTAAALAGLIEVRTGEALSFLEEVMVSDALETMFVRLAAEAVRIGLLALQALTLVEVVVLGLAVLTYRVVVALHASFQDISTFAAHRILIHSISLLASLALGPTITADTVRYDIAVGTEALLSDEVAFEALPALRFGGTGLALGNEVGAVQTDSLLREVVAGTFSAVVSRNTMEAFWQSSALDTIAFRWVVFSLDAFGACLRVTTALTAFNDLGT